MNSLMNSLEDLKNSQNILVLGTRVSTDSSELYNTLKDVSKKGTANVVYAHPIEDALMQKVATQFIKYEPGSEEGVIALLAYYLLEETQLPLEQREFLSDLDVAYLEAESNTGEEEFEAIVKLFDQSTSNTLVLGDDLVAHSRSENIARIATLIEENSALRVYTVSGVNREFTAPSGALEEVEELPEYNGTVIYNSNSQEKSESYLSGSAQFATAARIDDGDFISISFGGQTLNREFKIDSGLKGTIAINPTFDIAVDKDRYKFERSKINKINQRVRES